MIKKYSVDSEYNYAASLKGVNLKTLRSSSRREVKKTVSEMEKIFALIPDSIYQNKETIDSFYFNKNKIDYIEKNDQRTKNILLLRK